MINSLEEINKLRSKAEASSNKTAQVQQVLAQLEACLLRNESKKVKGSQKTSSFKCIKKFQTQNYYLRLRKNNYK